MGVISHILAGQHIRKHLPKNCQVKLEFYEESDLLCLTKRHSKFLTPLFSPILITVVQFGLTKNKGIIDKLYRLQKRAARFILIEKDR